ncbi:hypothetical protein [Paenibacillus sp. y28]|uniref:hypothetical protein n=1 Tax=Paenibacillus sp. y28 TaxID=3129110 RepID=UPI00301A49C8
MQALSDRAAEMLSRGRTIAQPKQADEIVQLLNRHGYPYNESFIRYQQRFGGIKYRPRGLYHGMEHQGVDLVAFEYDPRNGYVMEAEEIEGRWYYTCADYSYSHLFYAIVMDSEGRIYVRPYDRDDRPILVAQSIETFVERDAVQDDFYLRRENWLAARFHADRLEIWKNDSRLGLQLIAEASDSCTTWWRGLDGHVFVECHALERLGFFNQVYAASTKVLKQLQLPAGG